MLYSVGEILADRIARVEALANEAEEERARKYDRSGDGSWADSCGHAEGVLEMCIRLGYLDELQHLRNMEVAHREGTFTDAADHAWYKEHVLELGIVKYPGDLPGWMRKVAAMQYIADHHPECSGTYQS